MILIVLAIAAPITAASLIWPIIMSNDRRHIKKILLISLGTAVSWIAISSRGAEGAVYRLYVSIVSLIALALFTMRLLIENDKKAIRIRLTIAIILLLLTGVLSFFSEGVCC